MAVASFSGSKRILMKILTLIIAIVVTTMFVGCSKESASTTKVDASPIEKSFSSADPSAKSSADKIVTEVKAGNYAAAMTELKTLAGNAKLTPEQQQAIKDVMAQVQQAITDTGKKITEDVSKSATDLKNALPK